MKKSIFQTALLILGNAGKDHICSLIYSDEIKHSKLFLISLRGSAGFVEQNNRLVLYLDGTGANFAETPAIPLRQTDLTISVWIKLVSPLAQDSVQTIYGDWSFPWQFRFFMMDSGCPHFQARRDVDGIDDVFALGVTEHHR